MASLVDWWSTRTTSATGVTASPGPLADQLLKWMSKVPSLMWRPFSAIWITCSALKKAVTVPLLLDAVWPEGSS